MRVVIALTGVLALAACDSAEARDAKAAAQAVVTCADKAQEIPLPSGFPRTFPLPARTVVIGSRTSS